MRPCFSNTCLVVVVFSLTLYQPSDVVAQTYRVQVKCGKSARTHGFVHCRIPKFLQGQHNFILRESGSKTLIPVQKTFDSEPQLIWKLNRPLKPAETRTYLVSIATKNSINTIPDQLVIVDSNDKQLSVSCQKKPVLVYNLAAIPSHDPQKPFYARSGHIHPLYNPQGQVVTDDFAPDHPHQHGLFFAWTNTNWQGKQIDFWNQHKQSGTVAHAKLNEKYSGRVFGQFQVQLHHLDLSKPAAKQVALQETWDVRVYNQKYIYLIDLVSAQRAANSPMTINKFHYGGFAIRGQRNWGVKQGGKFLTSENKTRLTGNHTRPRWVSLCGTIEEAESCITIFDHPENFRFPQPVRLHPRMPYFCFAPLVLGNFEIGTDKPYLSRYRLAVTMGKPDPDLLEQIWEDYARPLNAEWVSSK